MPLASLIVFAMLLGTPLDRATQPSPTSKADTPAASLTQPNALPTQSLQLGKPASEVDSNSANVCYKIRAYIFKRDDDQAPVLVRSTTCGPRAPHVHDATLPNAKIVPLQ